MTGTVVETGTVLDRILVRTRTDLDARKRNRPIAALERLTVDRGAPWRLADALAGTEVAVIAEIKRASPSKGLFPVEVDPAAVAAEYLAGGAAALSVLTDEPFFRGSLDDLRAAAIVAHESKRPVLRKDFVLDEYQLIEALAYGADAVLLIVAALDQLLLARLYREANDLGLSVLVEVHEEEEMRRAAELGAEVIGINNRDLRSFTIDLSVTERVAPLAPAGAVLVSESGIFSYQEVRRLEQAGIDAVLVGESLIVASDRSAAVRALLGGDR
ncbi:MAG: indole-3-glycerol phosphate synthase TrpC [Thermomicrobiales bacterium]